MDKRIAHFQLLEKLGQGGMGVVYKARDEQLRRLVALKVLPRDFSDDPERRKRLLREARAAAAISHPNLAAIYQAGESDDEVYLAMELVEGKSLRELLAAGPLPLERAIAIGRSVLQALTRAHRHGVVHRDLKPDNVMVTDDGFVKVLDFGIASMVQADPQLGGASLVTTEEGRIVGTPLYMAPEQALGKRVDARADIFAFGVTLCELLTAKLPFVGSTPMERLVAVTRDAPSLPSHHDRNVPAWIDRLVARCLEKDPNARYASCEDVLAVLDRGPVAAAATVESVDIRAETVALVATPPPFRPSRAITLGAVAFLVAVGAFGLFAALRTRPVAEIAATPSSAPVQAPATVPSIGTTATATASASVVTSAPIVLPANKPTPRAPTAAASPSTAKATGPLDDQK